MSVRASLAYFVTRGASGALAVLTVAVFARALGPEGYAQWTLVLTIGAFIGGVLLQPVHATLARFLPQPGFETLPATLGRVLFVAAACGIVPAIVFEALAPVWWPGGLAFAALLLGASQGGFDFGAQYLSSRLFARRYGALYLVKAVIGLFAGWALLRLGFGVWGALVGMVAGYLLASAWCAPDAWRAIFVGRFDAAQGRAVVPYALPLALSLLTGYGLGWSDRLILSAHVPPAELGAYGAAADLTVQGVGLVFSALHLAWFPRLIQAWETERSRVAGLLDRYVQLSALVLLPAGAGLALVADDMARVLLGEAYAAQAAQVMPLLVCAALIGGVRTYLLDLPLHLQRRMGVQSTVVGVSAVCAIGLNLWAVPRHGAIGAAVVACVAQAVGCVVSAWFGRGVLAWRLPRRELQGVAVALALMAAAVWVMPGGGLTGLATKVATGFGVYALAVWILNLGGVRGQLQTRWVRGRDRHG